MNNICQKGNVVHGYGASTKGNVLLQYFNINKNLINFIAEKNEQKFNNFTPGTKIKIISGAKFNDIYRPDKEIFITQFDKDRDKIYDYLKNREDSFDEITWETLYKMSQKTFVDETESSKKTSAGAGLTDND